MDTDLVLGVAIAPNALGMVLVRWRRTDGQVLDSDRVDTTPPRAGHASGAVADKAKNAVLRTYSTAVKHGYRIHAVGVTCVGADIGEAIRLVDVLKQVGCRNVDLVDSPNSDRTHAPPDSYRAASVAAAHAVDIVRDPIESPRPTRRGRHRHRASTRRPLVLGGVAASVLAATAAAVVVNATSSEPPPVAAVPVADTPRTTVPTPAVVPAANVPPAPARTTPRSVFVGRVAEPSGAVTTPPAAPVDVQPLGPAPETLAEPVAAPVVPAAPPIAPPEAAPVDPAAAPVAEEPPPTELSEHLPGTADEPRLPGPG